MENLNYKHCDDIIKHLEKDYRHYFDRYNIPLRLTDCDLNKSVNKLIILGLLKEGKPAFGSRGGILTVTELGHKIHLEGKTVAQHVAELEKEKTYKEELEKYQFKNEKHAFRTNSISFYLMVLGALTGFYAFLDSIFKITEKIIDLF